MLTQAEMASSNIFYNEILVLFPFLEFDSEASQQVRIEKRNNLNQAMKFLNHVEEFYYA